MPLKTAPLSARPPPKTTPGASGGWSVVELHAEVSQELDWLELGSCGFEFGGLRRVTVWGSRFKDACLLGADILA